MGKKIIKMTEADLMKLIKSSLKEEMEDVDLGDRQFKDSSSDWESQQEEPQGDGNDVDTCIADLLSYDDEDGPPNANIVIHKAVFMAGKLRHFENNYDPVTIASALIQALNKLKQGSTGI
jgi:hypothetical protein